MSRAKGERIIERLEEIITQDPAGRGLERDGNDNLVLRCRGHLAAAARDLAVRGERVVIVTGFHVPGPRGATVETDGPGGAIALACLLTELGSRAVLMTDPLGAAIVEAGLRAAGGAGLQVPLEVFPFEHDDPANPLRSSNDPAQSARSLAFAQSFLERERRQGMTHLIAVERAGPSHWAESQRAWSRAERAAFRELCPAEHENQVHSFRGHVITNKTAKIHLLFDVIRERGLPIRTIGVGDGGNEIGMGSIPWVVLHRNIPSGLGARIACRVVTDWTIACGVSNWGAYALAAGVTSLRDCGCVLDHWTEERERTVLAALVGHGAVDGMTAQQELSVDGLPIEQQLGVWAQIRAAVS